MERVISVFGSAAADPASQEYADGVELGRALAQAGYTVMTGGYAGIMGAVSRGAYEVDGHVIGVTTDALRKIRPNIQVNQWVKEEVGYLTLTERLLHLVTRADGYVVLPGGIGTFTELMMVWELQRVGDIPQSPIIFYGSYWTDVLADFRRAKYFQRESWELISFAQTTEQVVELLAKPRRTITNTGASKG